MPPRGFEPRRIFLRGSRSDQTELRWHICYYCNRIEKVKEKIMQNLESFEQTLIVYGLGLFFAVLAVCMAKTPISRPRYVGLCFLSVLLSIGAWFITLPVIRDGDIVAYLALLMVVNALFFRWLAQRYIDLGWSRWWILSCIIPLSGILVIGLPFFYRSRLSVEIAEADNLAQDVAESL